MPKKGLNLVRFKGLSYLRGIAAFLVVYAHLVVVAIKDSKGITYFMGEKFPIPVFPRLLSQESMWVMKLEYLLLNLHLTSGELGVFILF